MNVFIAGGSRGIGRGIVLKFAEEGYGVAFTYAGNKAAAEETIRLAKEVNPEVQIRTYQMDQADSAQAEATADQAIFDFGSIEVLVNCGAILRNNAAAMMTDEDWDLVIKTNLSGPFYVTRSFLMPFIAQKFGRIIHISSLAQTGSSGQINYAASKGGLLAMSATLAREYGPKNVTSNVVTVGYVKTDMTDADMADHINKVWMDYCPMRRVGQADEIASAVHYLTTDKAGFINGEVLHVSGGLTYAP